MIHSTRTCLGVFFCVVTALSAFAQRTTEESFIPSYNAGNFYYLWGSRTDLEDVRGSSLMQHEVGLLAQYPVLEVENGRLTAGLRFRWNLFDFDGPDVFGEDLLDLYRVQIPLNYWHELNDQWKIWAGLEPGVFSDFEDISGEDFTATALVVAAYEWRPAWTLSFGGYYSRDLGDDRLLPVLGVIWRPNPHWNVSATFPRFRVAYAPDETMNFDFTIRPGGSGWNIRAGDRDVNLEYKSWRATLGMEKIVSQDLIGKIYAFGELGLGFGQDLTAEDDGHEIFVSDLEDMLTLSAGVRLRF